MSRLKSFLKNNNREIVLSVGVFLIAVISFQAGWLWRSEEEQKRVIISEFGVYRANFGEALQENVVISTEKPFVASRNSKKYHKADCSYSQKINEENKIWFASREEAEKMGFELANCCVKD